MTFDGVIATVPMLAARGGSGSFMPFLIILFVVISAIRSAIQAKRQKEKYQVNRKDAEGEQRAAEIRERLRRLAEERRGEAAPTDPAPRARGEPPPIGGTIPPVDPFGGQGGPIRRLIEELVPENRPVSPTPPPAAPAESAIERQLVEARRRKVEAEAWRKEREAEVREKYLNQRERTERRKRESTQQRAQLEQDLAASTGFGASGAPTVAQMGSAESAKRIAARERVVGDLRSADALRRAFVLREVLGPPVSLRK